jgi:hypothetical protein
MYLYQTASHHIPEEYNLNVFTVVKYSIYICFMILYVSDGFILNTVSMKSHRIGIIHKILKYSQAIRHVSVEWKIVFHASARPESSGEV